MERSVVIVAGFGFRQSVEKESLRAALALAQHGHPPVDALATLADKAPALATFAHELALPLIALPAASVEAAATRTRSAHAFAARNTGSVAEAAALAAAGPGARLLSARHVSSDRRATCALAQGISR